MSMIKTNTQKLNILSSASILIGDSILAGNILNMQEEILNCEEAGIDFHHIDVMDGHFVPNLTFGLPFIKPLKRISKIPIDVHLMITNPDEMAINYVKEGADWVTFHIEATKEPVKLINKIKNNGAKAGISINPNTVEDVIFPFLDIIDLILVMSVNPGFAGQKFIQGTENKVKKIFEKLKTIKQNHNVILAVDGGIDEYTAVNIINAGANALVAGKYIYNSLNKKEAINKLKSLSIKEC